MQAFILWGILSGALLQAGSDQAPSGQSTSPSPQVRVENSASLPGYTVSPCGLNGCLSPVEVVTYADALAPKAGVSGVLEMVVRHADLKNGILYLGSEEDYRDRNNVSVVLPAPMVERRLEGLAVTPENVRRVFLGKRIFVRGTAWRVRIDFLDDKNSPTGKYYYQVHMRLNQNQQLLIDTK